MGPVIFGAEGKKSVALCSTTKSPARSLWQGGCFPVDGGWGTQSLPGSVVIGSGSLASLSDDRLLSASRLACSAAAPSLSGDGSCSPAPRSLNWPRLPVEAACVNPAVCKALLPLARPRYCCGLVMPTLSLCWQSAGHSADWRLRCSRRCLIWPHNGQDRVDRFRKQKMLVW